MRSFRQATGLRRAAAAEVKEAVLQPFVAGVQLVLGQPDDLPNGKGLCLGILDHQLDALSSGLPPILKVK